MRTMGTVKWFDPTTGEGCAVSDGGTQAALTAAALQPFGLSKIDAGIALVYDVMIEGGRLIVAAIHEIAGKGPHTSEATGKQSGTPVRVKGNVQWFDANKGYGFVVSKDVVGDVLLHRSVLDAIGVDAIREGAVVDCDILWKLKGPQVKRIHAVLAPDKPVERPVEPRPEWGGILVGAPLDPDVVAKVQSIRPRSLPRSETWLHPPKSYGFIDVVDGRPWEKAVCKWFSRPKGFGFLRLIEGDEDIFVHMDLLRRAGIRELRPGQRVRVETERTERGLMAVAIELDEDNAGHA